MKKFVVLLALLAMVPFASAAMVTFDQEGPINAQVGDVITVSIVTDAPLMSFVGDISVEGLGAITSATNNAAADVQMSTDPVFGDLFAQFNEGSFTGLSGSVATFDIVYNGGTVVINLASADRNGGSFDMGGLPQTFADSLTIVPEPMTMALLGLGGLFIRRRRA